ncbi:MAG: copper resistance protein CopC [Geodermatophilaceae bacterium]|nr:copper resistance protein CopC [Geodermatophilaceae bacterium]
MITQFAQLTVTGPDGAGRQSGTPEVSGTTVTQPLTEQGPAGTYEVAWRVVSADGHPISGVFSYVVTTGPTTAVPPSPTAPTSTATAQAPRHTVVSASPAAAVSTAGSTNWVPIAAVLVVLLVALGVAAAVVSRRRGARGGGG